MDYKTSGVDIEAGRTFVEQIKHTVKSTHRPEVMGGFGGFNSAIKIPSHFKNPVLISGTDGVGTKLKTANLFNLNENIGIDLVAMCVNDVITSGAEPLFFLDYIATGKLKPETLGKIVSGVAKGCKKSGCSLIGGETAEMPSLYHGSDYDVAGFCVGIVEEENYLDGRKIKKNDIIIGIESNGLHSNGFSLINDMLTKHKLFFKDVSEIMNPTHIYANVVKDLLKSVDNIAGMAHITGGGLPENLPRIIPKGLGIRINYDSWQLPRIFYKIMMAGEISPEEMKNVFNLGVGYCIVAPSESENKIHEIITKHGYNSWTIGEVVL